MSIRALNDPRPERLWRLAKARYASTAASGDGGLAASGRWHRKGVRVVYLASTFSLAVVEIFVHTQRTHLADPLIGFEIRVPKGLAIDELAQPPDDWRAEPPPASTQDIGMHWLATGKAALLRVPSKHSPVESNYILNPARPDAAKLVWETLFPWQLDPRTDKEPR